MGEKLTWDEIKTRFPDEWVILVDLDVNDASDVTAGRVLDHSTDRNYIHDRQLEVREDAAILFTGKLHGVVASLGLVRVEIES